MFSVGKCDNLTVVLLSDVLDNEAELPDHCTPPGPLPLLAGPHLILVLQVTTHRQLALLSVTSLSLSLPTLLSYLDRTVRPRAQLTSGAGSAVTLQAMVRFLCCSFGWCSRLPSTTDTSGASRHLSSLGGMFAYRRTKYHQKLSNKSQLRYGSVFSNKRNMPASQPAGLGGGKF